MHLAAFLLAAVLSRPSVVVTPWPSAFGDLSSIAGTEHVSLQALEAANPQIHDVNLVYPGETVYLPSANTAQQSSAPVQSAVLWRGGSPNHYPFGWCTWGAANLARDDVDGLGDAWHWIYGAQARGMPTGSVPEVGATAVFQPDVQGASMLGHVAHVVAVGPDGSFEVEGMAAPNWGQYSFSWVHDGWGVSFIY